MSAWSRSQHVLDTRKSVASGAAGGRTQDEVGFDRPVGAGVRCRVDPSVAGKRVVPEPPAQHVVAVPAAQRVVAVVAEEPVVTRSTRDGVVALAGLDAVLRGVTDKRVGELRPGQVLHFADRVQSVAGRGSSLEVRRYPGVGRTERDGVDAFTARDRVVAEIPADFVVAVATGHAVVAVSSTEVECVQGGAARSVTAEACDEVVAVTALKSTEAQRVGARDKNVESVALVECDTGAPPGERVATGASPHGETVLAATEFDLDLDFRRPGREGPVAEVELKVLIGVGAGRLENPDRLHALYRRVAAGDAVDGELGVRCAHAHLFCPGHGDSHRRTVDDARDGC